MRVVLETGAYKLKVVLICAGMLISSCAKKSECNLPRTDQGPQLYHHMPQYFESINSYTPEVVADLTRIVIALDKFKKKNGHFPVSSNEGNGWDGLFSKWGESKEDWIRGLAPQYINSLPRDPRLHSLESSQYTYRSDGLDYKLISRNPSNCDYVERLAHDLIDKTRGECKALGFWTKGASQW